MPAAITFQNPQIQKLTKKIVKKFSPDKVILFGSHAWGKPGPNSDVDLFIIKKTRAPFALEQKIDLALIPRSIALDILVRTPKHIQSRLLAKDIFIHDVLTKGKILYAKK